MQGPLDRALIALGWTVHKAARELGVSVKELKALRGVEGYRLANVGHGPIWMALAQRVDLQLGLLVASRAELQARVQTERTRRAIRREAIRNR